MSAPRPQDVPSTDPDLVVRLRGDLAAAQYTVEAVEELLGPVATAALHREQALPAGRRTDASAHPAATLLRTFVLGGEVPRAALERALPGLTVDGAAQLGLVSAAGADDVDPVRARVDLRPYAATDAAGEIAWWIASDLGELATGRSLRPDHVLGVGGASATLARLTVRNHRARTLDLGTGCGIQALHAARHSDAVVATDVSRRALAFAGFNAALADVSLEMREGSMLEPVATEQFDLVVSNPPFVITPRGAGLPLFEYRDAGWSGDDVVRSLVQDVGRVLAPGGVAQLLGNWEHRGGEDWRERVGRWVDESGLEAWIVQRDVQDPAEYAETWLRDAGTTPERDPDGWESAYGAWLDDLASRDVEAVGFGMVLLRRPADGVPRLRRLEEQHGPVPGALGDHLGRSLAAVDLLARSDDDALLGLHLVVPADVTEERHLRPGALDPTLVLLRQGAGFGRVRQVGTALGGLVGACDGELSVGDLARGIAVLLDLPVDDLVRELVPQVRELVADGFLEPAT